MQKVVNIETKTNSQFSVMVWDIDSHYFRSYCLSKNIALKVQTQKTVIKNSYPKAFKVKKSKLACAKAVEVLKESKENKRKKIKECKQENTRKQKEQTSAISINTKASKKLYYQ